RRAQPGHPRDALVGERPVADEIARDEVAVNVDGPERLEDPLEGVEVSVDVGEDRVAQGVLSGRARAPAFARRACAPRGRRLRRAAASDRPTRPRTSPRKRAPRESSDGAGSSRPWLPARLARG